MNKIKQLDYLIIGQGLAGSLLAWQLIQAGKQVLVVDNGNPCAASKVAAGLVNPVTGKRLVLENRADIYLKAANSIYQVLANEFGEVFLHHKPMLRLFDNEEIKSNWQKRVHDSNYEPYLGAGLDPGTSSYHSGGFFQKQTGYLATGSLLDKLQNWLIAHNAYLESTFEYKDLQLNQVLTWKEYHPQGIIFCEGARLQSNPWFAGLPMQPAQGEILTLQTDNELPAWIINAGQWLLPLDDGVFKIGATHVWPTDGKPLNERPSAQGREVLLKVLPKLFPGLVKYQLVAQAVGIRPNTKDKRPLLGFHPQDNRLAVFNGFGSKGSMLIPYYAKHFVDVLLNGVAIETDVDIQRFV